ncbi:MAG: TonB-dependent receptor, partial [Proteobacteria bacterium]|nr:TonB-dependent receptor [Pseudomonadota bacterium]
NGIGLLDASGTSPDHAVSIDPLLIESIEILRGPSALLYGSTATGGVVNIRTNRIAESMPVENSADARFGLSSVDFGKTAGLSARYRLGDYVLHFDGSHRASNDYAIPGFARTAEERASSPLSPEETGRVGNSGNLTSQAGVGISRPFDRGHFGLAVSGFQSEYGTVKEKEVKIDLDRVRVDASGEIRKVGIIDSIRLKSAYTKYNHKEIDAGDVGTIFDNRGIESRVDAKIDTLIFGIQHQYFKLSATGDEAFLPTTLNSSLGIFAHKEEKWGRFTPSAGLRLESNQVDSLDSANLAFGPGVSKRFFAPSASLGVTYSLSAAESAQDWVIGLQSTYSERAPSYQELFANGAHAATGLFEQGDRGFKTEKNLGAELSLKTKGKEHSGRFSTFFQNYLNYIALSPTGTTDAGSGLDIYQYDAVRAHWFGAELEYQYTLPSPLWSGITSVEFKTDFVRAIDLSRNANLPRITPARGTLGVNYQRKDFSLDAEIQRVEGQSLIAANERATPGYTLVNLGVGVPFSTGFGSFTGLLRANNLFDVEARNHLSFLKEIAPLPGRNLFLGLQASL